MHRILHLTTYLQGGAGRAVVDLACAQREAGHAVSVVASATPCGEFGNYPHYLHRLADRGVDCHVVDSLFDRDPRAHRPVLDLLRRVDTQRRIDVVHAHAGTPARIGLAFARGLAGPVVIQTQHGWGTNKTTAQRDQDVATLLAMDRVVATSSATRGVLHALGVPEGHVHVVPCGLPREGPRPSLAADEVAAVFRRRGFAVVGCVGSVTANKNQAALIRALALVPGVAAIVVGEGGDTLAPLALAERVSDRVHLAGYRADGDAWLGSFDALVAPSRTEGQGLVVLEAFRAGVPVVASDIAPFRELVLPGATGWRCRADDPASVASGIGDVLRASPGCRARVCAAARRLFDERFSLEAMMAGHDRAYGEAWANRLAGPPLMRPWAPGVSRAG